MTTQFKSLIALSFVFNLLIINEIVAQMPILNKDSTFIETQPEFPEGQMALFRFLGQNIRYPILARQNGAQGTAYVGFIINTEGNLDSIHVKKVLKIFAAKTEKKRLKEEAKIPKEAYDALAAEAMRVVSLMPKWKAGTQQGKPVRVAYTLPIKFKLE